ncbi:hypothetical protein LR48_Vigan08g198400 [Vigna angularis]|uniref:Uncharacterized protein n=1 Tax=Phaseolus angularis TaxID=3914 RepID=A0A0L9V8D4_PHAAN|nr:hypothetical protein LR48_Vigan08g198400 [Vigna angularis]
MKEEVDARDLSSFTAGVGSGIGCGCWRRCELRALAAMLAWIGFRIGPRLHHRVGGGNTTTNTVGGGSKDVVVTVVRCRNLSTPAPPQTPAARTAANTRSQRLPPTNFNHEHQLLLSSLMDEVNPKFSKQNP